MTPSRSPPLPICRGCPSSSESFSRIITPAGRIAHPARVELEALRDVGDRVAGEHPDRALERLVLEHGADQRPQRGRAAADGDRLAGLVDLDVGEEVVDVVAQRADLGGRGRVVGEELLRERPGPDLEGVDLADAAADACRG